MVAVRTHHRLRESNRFVAARPVERRLQHYFVRRVALRFVESRGRLGLAKNIGHSVVADSFAAAEIPMRVVVEGAPADTARVLRIGGKLVVNARMPHGVLGQSFDLIDRLCRISVPHEFRVEITRMVRLLQRKTKIVHRENVFQKFGGLEIADPARLPRRIEAMR
jgi:hypothetical protein